MELPPPVSIEMFHSYQFNEHHQMSLIPLQQALSTVTSFEDFESLRKNVDLMTTLATEILNCHKLPLASLSLFNDGTNVVFLYDDNKVLKIYPPFHGDQFLNDFIVMKHLKGKISVKTPSLSHQGMIFGWPYLIMDKLDGTLLENLWDTLDRENKISILQELGALIAQVHGLSTEGFGGLEDNWNKFLQEQIEHCQTQHQCLSTSLLNQMPNYIGAIKDSLLLKGNPVLLTGEYTPMNILVKQEKEKWHIHGLIDFGDAMLGLPQYDLLGPGAFLIQGDKELLRAFLMAYGYSSDTLTEALSHQLTALMLLHRYSNLDIQVRIADWKTKVQNLKDLENLVWGF